MAIHHIPLETKSFIIKTIKALKVQNEITDKDINDLARLKEKRSKLVSEFTEIEKGFQDKHIKKDIYDKAKEKYEYETEELALEILTREQTIDYKKKYLKRLELLKAIVQFENENQFVMIGEERFYLNDLYKEFLKTIATENIQQLHYQQKLIRLKLLYNQNKHTSIDEKHKFYLSKDESINLKDQLYDLYDQIKVVESVKIDVDKIDFTKLSAMDFIEPNSSKLYERLFINNEANKKK